MAIKISHLEAWVQRTIPAIYDDSLSYYELLAKILAKVNEITDEVNAYFDEDIVVHVGSILNEWYENGKLAEIINNEVFGMKANQTDLDKVTDDVSYLKQNVKNVLMAPYNAVPNTDITSVMQQVVNDLVVVGGGTIYIPSGDYIMNASVDLPSNIHIKGDKNTILRKTLAASEGYLFTIGRTRGTTGYGGGGKNISIENIQFEGYAASQASYRALALSFNHAQHVVIRNCRFLNCITQDHAIDLAGCDDVLIENCSFEGSYQIMGREYNEAIQIDSSTPTAMPQMMNYDGLPTKNVTVRDCEFLPSYNLDGSIFNYAPNPIGNHGFTGTKYYENIIFENNLVVDGWSQNGNTGTDWYAWIHFYGLKDSKFINNRIVATKGQNATVFGFYTSSNGRYDPVTLVAGTGAPLPHLNIEIRGNTIQGFNHADTDGGIIRIYGVIYNEVEYKIGNIIIEGNQFDNNSVGMTNDQAVGRALVNVSMFNNVRVINNKSDNSRSFVVAFDGQYLTIADNHFSRSAMGGITLTNVFQIQIHNNIGENLRQPLNLLECYDIVVKGNIFTNIQAMLTDDTFDYVFRIRNANNLIFQGNIARTFAAAIEHGLYLYQSTGTSNNLYVFDNIYSGFQTSNVTTTGTLTNYINRNN